MSSLPLLRPLGIGEILDRSLRLYRSHFALLISIPLVAFLPVLALQLASQLIWHTTQWVDFLQSAFVQVLVSCALVVATSRAYLAQPPTVREAYQTASRYYGSTWGASFLMGLAIGTPVALLTCGALNLMGNAGTWLMILLVLPYAAFMGTRWSLMLPSILLEHLGAQAGLGRSWALTEGAFGKVFATSFLAGLLIVVLTTIPQYAVAYGLGLFIGHADIITIIETALAELSLILTTPVSVGVTVVLYYDLRVRKEGFDLAWQLDQGSQGG